MGFLTKCSGTTKQPSIERGLTRMSLKNLDRQLAQRRQTYRAVLDNPFTNEGCLWPHVNDQQHVWELIQTSILSRYSALAKVPVHERPLLIITDFNEIVSHLQKGGTTDELNEEKELLLVCHKDQDVPAVTLQQVPLLVYMSQKNVTLVPLPKGAFPKSQRLLQQPLDSGLMLVRGPEIQSLASQIAAKVDKSRLPWLDRLRFEPTALKLLKTSAPLKKPMEKAGKKVVKPARQT